MSSIAKNLLFLFVIQNCLSASYAIAAPEFSAAYVQHSKDVYPELIKIRRDLFDHPEASGEEKRTSKLVADYLKKLGLTVKENIGGYGVVGLLKGGKPGRRVAWRADMDAARYIAGDHDHSDNVLSHVCGHDVHTTMALGIANTLAHDRENLSGEVYFLFQPAEETQLGAKAMINDGLFDLVEPDEIYAAHVGPGEAGVISTKPGNVFAHSRFLEIEFSGVEGGDQLVSSIHEMMNSMTKLQSPQLFFNLTDATTDPVRGIASPDTIYRDYILFGGRPNLSRKGNSLFLKTELYTAEKRDIDNVVLQLQNQLKNSDFSNRFVTLRVLHEREGVDNDIALVEESNELIRQHFGESAIEEYIGQVPFASEDFGHFQRKAPGVYFFIGASNAEEGIVAFPHMPNFSVDEKVIEYGAARFSSLIRSRLD